MSELWPFLFEVNLIQRKARKERTVFVSIDEDGTARWTDHTGRMGRLGSGGFTVSGGKITHHRGGRELTPEQERAELAEFTVKNELTESDFGPIKNLIEQVGKPWSEWELSESETLHALLEGAYWKHINRLMHEPFDPTDS